MNVKLAANMLNNFYQSTVHSTIYSVESVSIVNRLSYSEYDAAAATKVAHSGEVSKM